MGYMGFGMRKEVYKRKPKEAFKRLKKANTSASAEPSQSGYDASKAYQQMRFKPAYKRLWFWVIAIILTVAVVYNFLETRVFSENRKLAEIALFEESGIKTYYESEKEVLDSIVQFVKSREGKVGWIGSGSRSGKMILEVRSEDYHNSIKGFPTGNQHIDRYGPNQHLEPEVIDGNLRFHINDRQVLYEHHWSCDIPLEYTRDVNTTFIKHLKTDYDELDWAIRSLASKNLKLLESEHGISIRFKKLNYEYLFVFTEAPDSLNKDNSLKLTPITEGVYWSRSRYFWW